MFTPTENSSASSRAFTVLLLLSVCAGAQEVAGGRPAPAVRINLPDAEARAAAASKAKELAALSLKAAKYHRQAVQADYFPKIGSSFYNLHFNKFMGQEISILNRSRGFPLLTEDGSLFLVSVTQPVTPVFKIREGVRIARADERIARARIDAAAAQVTATVERTYLSLLIALRQQEIAALKVNMSGRPPQIASLSGMPVEAGGTGGAALLEASKAAATADSRVAELTGSLNDLLGFPAETKLELEAPPPLIENVSTGQPPAQAIDKNPDVVEAQQTLVKARAAVRAAKLDYVPEVAGIWSYSYQNVIPLLPRDFSYVGFAATWNVFDFGKRERTISERSTQEKMAETNLALVRAKVSAGLQKTSLDVERTRRILQLTQKVAALSQNGAARYQTASLEDRAARAQADLDLFQAELDYRLACAEVKRVLGAADRETPGWDW